MLTLHESELESLGLFSKHFSVSAFSQPKLKVFSTIVSLDKVVGSIIVF